MRQAPTVEDEPHFLMRALSVDYRAGGGAHDHVHPWPQFLYASAGAIRAQIGGVIWITPPRRGLWIPAGAPHSLRMLGATALRTVYCAPAFSGAQTDVSVRNVNGLLHETILRICELGLLDGRAAAQRRLCEIFLDEMAAAETRPLSLALPADRRARRLADAFAAGGGDGDIDRLCAGAGLSRRTAERIFQEETGLSPARWRRLIVLSQAFEEITGGAAIEAAAERAGYCSRSAFADAFRKAFGCAPGAVAK